MQRQHPFFRTNIQFEAIFPGLFNSSNVRLEGKALQEALDDFYLANLYSWCRKLLIKYNIDYDMSDPVPRNLCLTEDDYYYYLRNEFLFIEYCAWVCFINDTNTCDVEAAKNYIEQILKLELITKKLVDGSSPYELNGLFTYDEARKTFTFPDAQTRNFFAALYLLNCVNPRSTYHIEGFRHKSHSHGDTPALILCKMLIDNQYPELREQLRINRDKKFIDSDQLNAVKQELTGMVQTYTNGGWMFDITESDTFNISIANASSAFSAKKLAGMERDWIDLINSIALIFNLGKVASFNDSSEDSPNMICLVVKNDQQYMPVIIKLIRSLIAEQDVTLSSSCKLSNGMSATK